MSIVGGGVAGLEAMLALRALAGTRVEIELLSPSDQFVYRPMLVAEPFGAAEVLRLDLRQAVGSMVRVPRRRVTAAAVRRIPRRR